MATTETGLQFNEALHQYTSPEGVILPSVTTIIKEARLMGDMSWCTDASMTRGAEVHKAIHYQAEDDLDPHSVPDRLLGYLSAYDKFTRETGLEVVRSELILSSFEFAGTTDMLAGRGWRGNEIWLIDWKTGPWRAWHDLQLAAYWHLVHFNGISMIEKMRMVQLRTTGSYKIHAPKTSHDDAWEVFAGALKTYQWKQARGLLQTSKQEVSEYADDDAA